MVTYFVFAFFSKCLRVNMFIQRIFLDISQSKYFYLDGFLTYSNTWNTSTYPTFILSRTFHHRKIYRRNIRSQLHRGYQGHGHERHPRHPLKIISYTHHINQSTRGPFFHTTQPLTKINPKRKI